MVYLLKYACIKMASFTLSPVESTDSLDSDSDSESEFTMVDKIVDDIRAIPNHNPNTYKIVLPVSEFGQVGEDSNNDNQLGPIHRFDRNEGELLALATDELGENKKLSGEQFSHLRSTGQIVVPSDQFPGQNHVWQISSLLQKGTTVAATELGDGVAGGTRCYVETIPNLVGRKDDNSIFTLNKGIRSFGRFMWDIPHMLVGMPRHDKDYYGSISAELDKYRVDQLFETIIEQNIDGVFVHVFTTGDENGEKIPVKFIINKDNESFKLLKQRWSSFMTEWNNSAVQRRTNLVAEYTHMSVDTDHNAVLQTVANKEAEILQDAVYNLIRHTLAPNEADTVTALIELIRVLRQEMFYREGVKRHDTEEYMTQLRADHTILSRIRSWLDKKRSEFSKNWDKRHPLDEFIVNMKDHFPHDIIYSKNVEILTSEAYKQHKKELVKRTRPAREFTWDFRIWNPSSWKITESGGYYNAEKYSTVTTTTNMPCWRLTNIALGTASVCWNTMYYVGKNMIWGPFGLRSLFGTQDYNTSSEIDRTTGQIRACSPSTTWFGSLVSLWQSIKDSRRQFEETADNGILGKGFSRFFNRLWNYGVKGLLGTPIVALGYPMLVLLNAVVSGGLFVASPLIGFGYSTLRYAFNMLLYDLDGSRDTYKVLPILQSLIKVLIGGVARTLLTTTAISLYAGWGLIRYGWALLCYITRYLYDTMIFYTILRWRARIPKGDSFTARRVAGPDIGRQYFHRVDPDLVFGMLHYELEKLYIDMYITNIRRDINGPTEKVYRYMEQFKPAGLKIDESSELIKSFTNVRTVLNNILNTEVSNYHRAHPVNRYRHQIQQMNQKIRMSAEDLDTVFNGGPALCEAYYNNKLKDRINVTSFWNNLNLLSGDWSGMFLHYFKQIFGETILEPIEDVDKNGFVLDVKHVDFDTPYKEIISSALNGTHIKISDDLTDEDDDDHDDHHVSVSAPLIRLNKRKPMSYKFYNDHKKLPIPTYVVVTPQDMFSTSRDTLEKYLYLEYDEQRQKEIRQRSELSSPALLQGPLIVIGNDNNNDSDDD